MSSYKLYYFNGKGRAEMIRLTFAAAGKEYEDIRLEQKDFGERKADFPFGQVPVLEVNGKMYGQSMAIVSFLGREFGMYGSSNVDAIVIEQVMQLIQDLLQTAVKFFFEKDEKVKEEAETKFKGETCPKFYGFFEKMLKDSGSGFFLSKMSVADVAVYDMATGMMAKSLPPMDDFPMLKALVASVGDNAGVKAYVEKRPQTFF